MSVDWTGLSDNGGWNLEAKGRANPKPVSMGANNIQQALLHYRALVKGVVDATVYFLDTMTMRSHRNLLVAPESSGQGEKLYADLKLTGDQLRKEIEAFETNELEIFKSIADGLSSCAGLNAETDRSWSANGRDEELSRLKVTCQKQRNEIDRLKTALYEEKTPNIFDDEMPDVGQRRSTRVAPMEQFERRHRSYLETIRHDSKELDDTGGKGASPNRNPDDSQAVIRSVSVLRPRKSLNERPLHRSRIEFQGSRQRSVSQRKERSTSVFGDTSPTGQEHNMLSMKSDVDRQKQEIAMLNREIEVLRKELARRTREMEVVAQTFKSTMDLDKRNSSALINKLTKEAEDREKELSETSRLSGPSLSTGNQPKAISAMKQGLGNLFKEKRELRAKLTSKENEFDKANSRIEQLNSDLQTKLRLIAELEAVNQQLMQKYSLSAQREQKLAEKLERLALRLKAYDKFFNEQQ